MDGRKQARTRVPRHFEENPAEARDRPCMRCGTVFRSPSFGVRMCDHCRKGIDDSAAFAGGLLGRERW